MNVVLQKDYALNAAFIKPVSIIDVLFAEELMQHEQELKGKRLMNFLTIDSNTLAFMDGTTPFRFNGNLMWGLPGFYLEFGEAETRKVIEDRLALGSNSMTVLSMWSRWPNNFHPSNPNYEGMWRPFVDLFIEYQMRLIIVVFADTKPGVTIDNKPWLGMPSPGARKAHWEWIITALGDKPNVSYIVGNQIGHPSQDSSFTENEVKSYTVPQIGSWPKPLAARDNPWEAKNPILPTLDFSGACTKRGTPDNPKEPFWWAEIAWSFHNYVYGFVNQASWSGTRGNVVLIEPARIIEGSVFADPSKWRQLARQLCMKGCGGGFIWSDQDRNCQIYSGITRDCGVEFHANVPQP